MIFSMRETLDNFLIKHRTRGLRKIFNYIKVLGVPYVWIMRIFLKCTFRDVIHYFSHGHINMKRR
jgi:hypothetical protein